MADVDEILTRGVANIIPGKKELEEKLKSGKKLNVYLGIDPTATKIHLGNAVPLRKLQQLAEIGHNITFLIGDSTALIGDTSDKDSERPALTREEIEENFKTYKKQAEKILDFTKIKIRRNSEWLDELKFSEIIKLCQLFSVGDFTSRELIKKRLTEGKRVGLHEFLYPAMQAYDSWYLKTDLQIGGTDQTFNMQAGRTLIKERDNRESFVLTTPILEGTDGRKMSKSWNNAIWLEDEPSDIYRKVMAIPDNLILNYLTLATDLSIKEIDKYSEKLKSGENPINIKKKLAEVIVSELCGSKSSEEAREKFERGDTITIHSVKLARSFVSNASISQGTVELGLASSISDAKRVIEQNGLKINNSVVNDPNKPLSDLIKGGETIQRGQKKAVKIEIED